MTYQVPGDPCVLMWDLGFERSRWRRERAWNNLKKLTKIVAENSSSCFFPVKVVSQTGVSAALSAPRIIQGLIVFLLGIYLKRGRWELTLISSTHVLTEVTQPWSLTSADSRISVVFWTWWMLTPTREGTIKQSVDGVEFGGRSGALTIPGSLLTNEHFSSGAWTLLNLDTSTVFSLMYLRCLA